MGCAQSKIENEEAVTRCKERKQLMKNAVTARNAFAAEYSAYAMALKNTGDALSDYSHGEFLVSGGHSSSSAAISPPSPTFVAVAISNSTVASSSSVSVAPIPYTLPPPPPPPLSLQRAATMPEMNNSSCGHYGNGLNGTIIKEVGTLDHDNDDEDDDFELENHDRLIRKSRSRGGSNRGRKMIDEHQEEAPPPPTTNSRR